MARNRHSLGRVRRPRWWLALIGACGASACKAPSPADVPELVEVRARHGDTLVVTQASGQRCGVTGALREDLRIGRTDGPDEYLFGRIIAMAARSDGPVFVYDDQFHALRAYGRDGKFIRNIGRRGSGPGEYQYIIGLAVLQDGRLAAWDVPGHRVNLYTGAGEHVDDVLVALGQTQFIEKAFAADTANSLYVLTWGAGRLRMLRVDHRGLTGDTLWYPRGQPFLGTHNVHPRLVATFHPHGYFVHGVADRYAIHARTPDGAPLRIERTTSRVPFAPEERTQLQARLDWSARGAPAAERPRGQYATVPPAKPFFTDILVGRDGAIWVLRQRESRRRAAPLPSPADSAPRVAWAAEREFDVFAPDGGYRGRVPVPERTTIRVIDGNTLWGVARDDYGVESIVRYTLTDFC